MMMMMLNFHLVVNIGCIERENLPLGSALGLKVKVRNYESILIECFAVG